MRAVLRRERLPGPGGMPPPLAVELRSDAVSRPCTANVGDDDYGGDPAVSGGRRGRASRGPCLQAPDAGAAGWGARSGTAGAAGTSGVPKPPGPSSASPPGVPCLPAELQLQDAGTLGTESALFVPTATMANLIAGESGAAPADPVPPGFGLLPLAPSLTALLSQGCATASAGGLSASWARTPTCTCRSTAGPRR